MKKKAGPVVTRRTNQEPVTTLAMGVTACSTIGLVSALFGAEFSRYAGPGAMRTLVLVVAVYGTAGLLTGALALLLPSSTTPGGHRALALSPTLLLPATSWARAGFSTRVIAYAALGLVLYRVAVWLLERLPELGRSHGWFRLHTLLLSAGFILALPPLSDRGVPFGAGVLALAITLVGLSMSRKVPLLGTWGASATILAASTALASRPPPTDRPDVERRIEGPSFLLVTIDTLRADHVGAYGHEAARTPNMDALARSGVRFDVALTHSPYTGPSHLSMLTGRLPTSLDVTLNEMPLPKSHRTLADWLRREGYLTAGFISGWPLVDEVLKVGDRFHTYEHDLRGFRFFPPTAHQIGLLQGLDRYLEKRGIRQTLAERPAELAADRAIDWLTRISGSPFFAWVHFYDPHLPYTPPERHVSRELRAYTGPASGAWYGLDAAHRGEIIQDPASMAHMSALYDAEIAYADEQLGRVVEAARRAAPGPLMIIVTSDHGEAFGEHQIYFSRDLYEPTLRVPLIVVPPERPVTSVVRAQVKLTDLAPTVLDAAQIKPYDPMDGVSLLPWIRGSTVGESGPAFAIKPAESREFFKESHAVLHGRMKLIQRTDGWEDQDRWTSGFSELYDLGSDPKELRDLIEERPEDRGRLESLLKQHLPEHGSRRLDLTKEQLERLRSLGYMD